MVRFFVRYLQKLPWQTRAVLQTCLYGLGAGAATVAFQLGMNWLYRLGLVALSHQSLAVLDHKRGSVVGVVTLHDLLRSQLAAAERVAEAGNATGGL